jgi:polysaccharide biosynthesis/export protein
MSLLDRLFRRCDRLPRPAVARKFLLPESWLSANFAMNSRFTTAINILHKHLLIAGSVLLISTGLARAEQDYRLGPEDTLTIQVLDVADIPDRPVRIDKNGFIDLPLVGRIKAAGQTPSELETSMAQKLTRFVRNPRVSIHVAEYHSSPVSVLGEVNTPGVYQLSGPKHLLEMLSTAGGLKPDAGSVVEITREVNEDTAALPNSTKDSSGQYMTAEIDLTALLAGKTPADNILVQPKDVISIPKADLIYVVGDVKKAGGFTLRSKEKLTVLQALSLAEGLERTAAAKKSKILRKSASSADRTEIPVDLNKMLASQMPDVPLQADDILVVPNNAARSVALRTVEAVVQVGTGVAIYRR